MVGALERARWQTRRPAARDAASRRTAQRSYAPTSRYMNEMVDRIIRERRAAAATRGASRDLLELHADRRRPADRRAARRRQHPLPGHHLPDRRARDDQRAAVVRALLPAQEPGGAGRGPTRRWTACSGRIRACCRPTRRSTSSPTSTRSSRRRCGSGRPRRRSRCYAVRGHRDRRAVPAEEGRTTIVVLAPHAAPRPGGLGRGRRGVRPGPFRARAPSASVPPNAYKPFGNGQRACIGRQFAMQEAALVLGDDPAAVRAASTTRDYQLEVKETLTIKPDGFRIKVKRARPRRVRARRPRRDRGRAVAARRPPRRPPAPTAAAAHGTPLLVLYGSNLGTAEGLARRSREDAASGGFAVDGGAARRPRGRAARARAAVVIVTASYNGTPPDNAATFCDWLRDAALAADALAGVAYTVFGCGNRDWAATYQAVPHADRRRLAAHGAERLYARGEGDARERLRRPVPGLVRPLWRRVGHGARRRARPRRATRRASRALRSSRRPAARPARRRLATAPCRWRSRATASCRHGGREPSERSTRHIEIELPDGRDLSRGRPPGRRRRATATRSSSACSRRFELDADACVLRLQPPGGPQDATCRWTSRSAARLLGELRRAAGRRHPRADRRRSPSTPSARATQPTLCWRWPATTTAAGALPRRRSCDAAQVGARPARGVPGLRSCRSTRYLEMLPPLRPRYYSISSSPLADARRCSITVAWWRARRAPAAASSRASARATCAASAEGSTIHALRQGHRRPPFRLPGRSRDADHHDRARHRARAVPRLPAGARGAAGAGRAGRARRCSSSAAAIRGRTSSTRTSCGRFERAGVTRLFACFSRVPDEPKIYVQDQRAASSARGLEAAQAGAVVYVCGDATRMAPGRAARASRRSTGRRRAATSAPRSWLDELTAENRYLVDVWAAS